MFHSGCQLIVATQVSKTGDSEKINDEDEIKFVADDQDGPAIRPAPDHVVNRMNEIETQKEFERHQEIARQKELERQREEEKEREREREAIRSRTTTQPPRTTQCTWCHFHDRGVKLQANGIWKV